MTTNKAQNFRKIRTKVSKETCWSARLAYQSGHVTNNSKSFNTGVFSTPVKKIGISGRTKNYRVRARLKGVAMSLEMAKIKFELCYVTAVSYKYPNTKKKLKKPLFNPCCHMVHRIPVYRFNSRRSSLYTGHRFSLCRSSNSHIEIKTGAEFIVFKRKGFRVEVGKGENRRAPSKRKS